MVVIADRASRPRVLVVDDDPAVLVGLRRQLGREFAVTTTGSAVAALEALRQAGASFAVIVCDTRMRDAGGVALLTRARECWPDTTRVLLTASTDVQSAITAVNSGHVYKYLCQPCPGAALVDAVREAAEHHLAAVRVRARLAAAERRAAGLESFAAAAAHDLRAPLDTINGAAATLAREWDRLEAQARTDQLRRIGAETTRAAALVGDLLELALEHSAATEICADPEAVVAAAVQCEHLHDATVTTEGTWTPVAISEPHLVSVLSNLISNASRYGRERDGRLSLTISARPEGNDLAITVRDTGPGVPPSETARVFEPFERGTAATPAARDSTGLGLAVVKRFVSAAGGRVGIAGAVGGGCAVTLSIPCGLAAVVRA